VLNDSRAVAVVVSAPLLPKVLEVRKEVPLLKHVIVAGGDEAQGVLSLDALLAAASDELSPADTTPDDECFWLYSSGTTGFPKGAVHLQHDMVYCTDTYGAAVLRTTERDRHFTVSPLFHAYGLGNGVFFPFAVGASSVYKPERATPDLVYSLITQERPTILFTAPTFYAALLAYPEPDFKYDLSSLRTCVSAGEALPKPLFDQWKKRFGLEILDGIGATEMLHIFISNYPGKAKGGTSGTPVPGYRAKIVDDNGAELGNGETGNLWVSGDSCAAYYWNKHEKSKAAFKGEWYVTGDKYHLDADGYYTYEGRSDDMLKVSGQWVSPAEVEAALMEHPAVLECGVVGAKDKDELVTAFIERLFTRGLERFAEFLKTDQPFKLRMLAISRYVAADISAYMLERARREAYRLEVQDVVEFVEADVTALEFADASFDLCVTYNGLHCLPDPRAALGELAGVLERADVPAALGPSEAQILWTKLVRLNALALTTSATGRRLGFIRTDPEWRAALEACIAEAAAVANADGARIDPAAPLAELDDAHAELGSSMQRDIAAGREPELDAIAGSVLRAAARHGLACPTIARLARVVAGRAGIEPPLIQPNGSLRGQSNRRGSS